jgi:hypothetical protein
MSEIDPFETLRQISGGYCLSRALHVLAELNVADALGGNGTVRYRAGKSRRR